MAVFLLDAGSDPDEFAALKLKLAPSIPDLVVIANVSEIGRHQVEGRAIVLIAAPSQNREVFAKLLSIVTRYRGAVFFILISGEISVADYKALVQSGGADWVADTAPVEEILDVVARQSGGAPAAPDRSAGPTLASFLPSVGGVGNATLATETGVQLARGKAGGRRKICLVDLDVQTSHVCDYLDIAPHLQIEEFVAAPQRLDAQLLDTFCSRHQSGLAVFAAPRNRLRSVDFTVEALDAFLGMVAQSYDFMLIDLPAEWRPWTVHVLAASQGIVVTGVNVIPGLRQIAETLAALRGEPRIRAAVRVAINRCKIDMLGRVARRAHVDAVLKDEQKIFVRESETVADCADVGQPISIAHPTQKIVKEIGKIAEFCAGLALGAGVKAK